MKKVWYFIQPSLVMLVGFVLTMLIQSVVQGIMGLTWSVSMSDTLTGILIGAVIMFLLGIFVDRKESKFGFIPMILLMIAFAVLNILFAGKDPVSSIATVGNWEFSMLRMLWYNVTDWLGIPFFTVKYEMFINISSIVVSVLLVVSFMLLGSLIHRKKKD